MCRGLLWSLAAIYFSILFGTLAATAAEPGATYTDPNPWSKPVAGLEARITFVQKDKYNGTPQLIVYLELRNVRDLAHPLKVPCDSVKFELVDAEGKVVRDGWSLPRSGPHAGPGVVSLPWDSSMRINMYCSNWGVPQNAAAMISTDSGAWILKDEERQKVYLRATLKSTETEPHPDNLWKGTLETPKLRVEWTE